MRGRMFFGEFGEGADAGFLGGHSDVGFVDAQSPLSGGGWGFSRSRVAEGSSMAGELACVRILHDAADVGGRRSMLPLSATTWTLMPLPCVSLPANFSSARKRDQTPILIADHGVGVAVPLVEVADDAELQRVGGPFAIPDAGLVPEGAAGEAKVVVALADRAEQSAGGVESGHGGLEVGAAFLEAVLVGLSQGSRETELGGLAGVEVGHGGRVGLRVHGFKGSKVQGRARTED